MLRRASPGWPGTKPISNLYRLNPGFRLSPNDGKENSLLKPSPRIPDQGPGQALIRGPVFIKLLRSVSPGCARNQTDKYLEMTWTYKDCRARPGWMASPALRVFNEAKRLTRNDSQNSGIEGFRNGGIEESKKRPGSIASPVIARERSDRSNLYGKNTTYWIICQYASSYLAGENFRDVYQVIQFDMLFV